MFKVKGEGIEGSDYAVRIAIMHWLDVTLLTTLAVGAVLGFVSGLFMQIARLATLAVAVITSILYHEEATNILRSWVLSDAQPGVVQACAYVSVFLVVYIILFLVTRLLRTWLRATDLALPDRLLGAMLGAGKIALLGGVVCLLLRHAPHPAAQDWLEHSTLAPVFAHGMEQTVAMIPEDCKQPVLDSFRKLQEAMARQQSKGNEN